MRILIVGAGKAGLYLAMELRRRHEVTVIETRLSRADMVNSMMPDVTVIHGDACEPEVLEHAGIEKIDVTIAATGDDEDNIVVAMLAKHYGEGKVFARINHPKNEWLFTKEFGVDVPVSSARVLLSLVEKEIGFGDLVTLLRLQAEHVSIEEITLVDGAEAIGKRLSQVQLPSTAHVMAIITPDKGLTIATGETVLAEGDQLLLISQGEEEDPEVRKALGV
ncbi:MAG: potassium channel family protein [Coriobacteriia bacterium]